MKLPFLLWLYQRAAPILEKGVMAYVHYRLKKGKEDPNRLNERFGKPSIPRPEGAIAWFHGASVGEAVSLLPLLHHIRKRFPHITPLITTGTVAAATVMAKSLPKGCVHQYIPLDVPAWMNRFLDYWQPHIAVFVESEFWPNLILSCQARNIPLYLVNAHLSEKSYHSWQRFSSLIERLLPCFELCLAQSKTIAKRLECLGAPSSRIQVCGNLKFAASPLPCDANELARIHSLVHGRLLWVAASTHPGEEAIIGEIHHIVKQTLPSLLTILIPRHPHRGVDIATDLEAQGLNVVKRSCQDKIESSTDIYLGDTIGELGLFYHLSNVAFIGGTLVPIGGHNPIEPALLGCALVWGPYTHQQTEICGILEPAASPVKTKEDLAQTLERLLVDKQLRQEKVALAHQLIATQAHVLDHVVNALSEKLLSPAPIQNKKEQKEAKFR